MLRPTQGTIMPFYAAMLLIAAPTAAGADLKPFEFRGMTAGVTMTDENLKKCRVTQPEVKDCVEGYVPIAGMPSFVMETFYQSRLSTVGVTSAQGNWTKLRAAFIEKYGEPCEQATPTWQNAAGTSIRNIEETWCFTTGKLFLRQYGNRITETLAFYQDDNKAPAPAPKVDF